VTRGVRGGKTPAAFCVKEKPGTSVPDAGSPWEKKLRERASPGSCNFLREEKKGRGEKGPARRAQREDQRKRGKMPSPPCSTGGKKKALTTLVVALVHARKNLQRKKKGRRRFPPLPRTSKKKKEGGSNRRTQFGVCKDCSQKEEGGEKGARTGTRFSCLLRPRREKKGDRAPLWSFVWTVRC